MIVVIAQGFGQKRTDDGGGLGRLRNRIRAELSAGVAFAEHDDEIVSVVVRLVALNPAAAAKDIVLIGYSYGGGAVIRAAEVLAAKGIKVVLVLIDPVPRWVRGQFQNFWQVLTGGLVSKDSAIFALPENVQECYCYYQRNSSPWGCQVTSGNGRAWNFDYSWSGVTHVTFPGYEGLQTDIIDRLRLLKEAA